MLVTDGLIVCSRNAIYGEMIAALLGIGVVLGSMIPIAVALIIATIICTRLIAMEEKMLVVTFGDEYLAYKAGV